MASTTLNRRVNIYINDKDAGKTIKTIGAEARKLSNEINKNLTPGTKEYYAAVNRLRELNGTLANHRKAVSGVGSSWTKIKEQIISFAGGALAFAGFQQLVSGIDNLIGRNAELSDSYADVMKTTGLTRDEVEELASSFKSFNTRTSKKELLELARIAGKNGVTGFANLRDIVKETDQVIVALGKDLGAGSEDVVGMLLKLTEVYGLTDNMDMGEAIRRTGSAVNELGANSNANEGYIVEFTKRLGGVAPLANISAENIMGLAATFDVLGQSQEVAATASIQFLTKIGEDVPKFAKLAGMSVAEFSKLLKENGNDAMIAVLKGAKATEGGLEALAKSMGDMGAEGVRSIGVLGALSQNLDVLVEQQKLSNKAFEEGTSLANEFAIKNDNFAAKLERISRWFTGKFINGGVMVAFEKLATVADDFVKVPVSETLEKERMELNSLVSMLITHNDNQVRRKEIIEEIQSKYPDFLKNMDTELMTTETLTAALEQYNKGMLRKITLQAYEEELMELAKQKVELEKERFSAEKEANTAAQEAAKILGVELNANMSLLEKLNVLQSESNKLSLSYFDSAKREKASKYINEIQSLVKNSFTRDALGLETGMSQFDSSIEAINAKMQQLLELRNAFDSSTQTEAPAWLKGPIAGLSNIDPNTKMSEAPKVTELTEEEKKAIEERLNANKKMLEELAMLRISMIEDDFERELALLEHKKQLDKDQVINSKASKEVQLQMLLALDEKYLQDVKNLNSKYFEIQQKEGKKNREEEEAERKKQYETEYRNLVAQAQLKILNTVEGSRERMQAEQELIVLQANWELMHLELTDKEKLLLKAETLKKLAELEAKYRQQIAQQTQEEEAIAKEHRDERINNSLQYLQESVNVLQNIFNVIHENRMLDLEAERAALEEKQRMNDEYAQSEKDRVQEAYEEKRITREEYDRFNRDIDARYAVEMQKEQQKLDKQAALLQEKQAKRNKAMAIVGALINGAQAVMQGIAQFGPPPSPAGIAAIAAAVATTGVQVGLIAAQKIPKFAKGGRTDYPTFASGGHVSSGQLGIIGERGPEWVAPNWMLTNPGTANIIGLLEEVRLGKRMFAEGGNTNKSVTPAPMYSQPTASTATDPKLLAVLSKIEQRLGEAPTANVYLGDRLLMEMNERVKRLENSQSKGRA